MIRPFKLNEATVASIGALLLILFGTISPLDALKTLLGDWNVFLFFLGMMTISALAETAGIFDWLAIQAARNARSSGRRLYLNIFLLGSLISMFLSNDATALILTPVVYVLTTKLGLPVLPFLFACTFIADTASFLLPISNPINIIVLSKFPIDLVTFLELLFVPSLIVISINFIIFYLLYRKQLKAQFDISHLPLPEDFIRHLPYFRYTQLILVTIALAYIIGAAFRLPLSLIATGGALSLLLGGLIWKQVSFKLLSKQISWSIFGFIAGMFIVIRAIHETGITSALGKLLLQWSGNDPFRAVFIGTLGTALGTNLINNVPMAALMTSTLATVQNSSPAVHHALVAATIFGCDLGPNLTTVGSLATILWLLILRRRGVEISGTDYLKIGIIVTPAMLVAGALAIWILVLPKKF
jgi:arsenical pump membrane protein